VLPISRIYARGAGCLVSSLCNIASVLAFRVLGLINNSKRLHYRSCISSIYKNKEGLSEKEVL